MRNVLVCIFVFCLRTCAAQSVSQPPAINCIVVKEPTTAIQATPIEERVKIGTLIVGSAGLVLTGNRSITELSTSTQWQHRAESSRYHG